MSKLIKEPQWELYKHLNKRHRQYSIPDDHWSHLVTLLWSPLRRHLGDQLFRMLKDEYSEEE